MPELRYTLLADGPSDRALMPVVRWALEESGVRIAIQDNYADLRRLPRPPRGLVERIRKSVELYPCDLLFVHRDAEGEPRETRENEIRQALRSLGNLEIPAVCVIPVRMQEARLLFDEDAIRRAAGDPRGRGPLVLPRLAEMEDLPDPKATLRDLLRDACGLRAGRRRQLRVHPSRVAELIDDFAPLRNLSAFRAMEAALRDVIRGRGWAE